MKLSRTILAAVVVLSFLQTRSSAGKFAEIMERLKTPVSSNHFFQRIKPVVHEYEEFVPSGRDSAASNEYTTVSDECSGSSTGCHQGCDYCDGSGCSICDIRVNERLQIYRKIKGESYYPSRAPICESNYGFYHTCWRKLPPIPDRCRQKLEQQPETAAPQKVFHLPGERSAEGPDRTDSIPVFDAERLKRETQTLEYYSPKTVSGQREK